MTLLLLLAWLVHPAAAVGNAGIPGQQAPTVASLSADLASGDRAERRFAARSLRAMVRQDVRRSAQDGGTELDRAEARMALDAYDQQAAPACRAALAAPEVTAPCADLLRWLETVEALPALRAAREAETRGRVRRRLDRAIAFLEQVAAEAPAP